MYESIQKRGKLQSITNAWDLLCVHIVKSIKVSNINIKVNLRLII